MFIRKTNLPTHTGFNRGNTIKPTKLSTYCKQQARFFNTGTRERRVRRWAVIPAGYWEQPGKPWKGKDSDPDREKLLFDVYTFLTA